MPRWTLNAVKAAALLGLAASPLAGQAGADTVLALFEARMRELGIPGAQLVVVRDGNVAVSINHGTARANTNVPVGDSTRFRIGSLSKLFTAVAAARLWSRGQLDVDAPVVRLVPEFVGGTPGVTARLLAGHLGGVRHYVARDFVRAERSYGSVIEPLSIFAADTLLHAPGSRYLYSSFGYNLLGAAVERAAREDFRVHVHRTIVAPLGLSRTMFERADSAISGRSDPFDADTGLAWRGGRRSDLSDRWPSGGMLSTAGDLARFADAMIRGNFLTDRERALLFTSMTLPDGKETGVGFGWRIGKDKDGRVVYHHGGAVQGGRAIVVTWRDEAVSVAITTNLSPGRRQVSEADAMAIGQLLLSR